MQKKLVKEKEEFLEEVLTKVVQNYVKYHAHLGDDVGQALNSFTGHLRTMNGLLLVTLRVEGMNNFIHRLVYRAC